MELKYMLRECQQQHLGPLNKMLRNSEISWERYCELRDGDPYLARWGFTMYRTYYGLGSHRRAGSPVSNRRQGEYGAGQGGIRSQ